MSCVVYSTGVCPFELWFFLVDVVYQGLCDVVAEFGTDYGLEGDEGAK